MSLTCLPRCTCPPSPLTHVYHHLLHMSTITSYTCVHHHPLHITSYTCPPSPLTHLHHHPLHISTITPYTCPPSPLTHVHHHPLHMSTITPYTCSPSPLPHVHHPFTLSYGIQPLGWSWLHFSMTTRCLVVHSALQGSSLSPLRTTLLR